MATLGHVGSGSEAYPVNRPKSVEPRSRGRRLALAFVILLASLSFACTTPATTTTQSAPSTSTTVQASVTTAAVTTTTESSQDAFRRAIQPLWEAEQEFDEVVNPVALAYALAGGDMRALVRERALWKSARSAIEVDQLLSDYDFPSMVWNEKTKTYEDFRKVRQERRSEEALKSEAALTKIAGLLTQSNALAADLETDQVAMAEELRAGVEAEMPAITTFREADEARAMVMDERLRTLEKLDGLLDRGAPFPDLAGVIDDELLPAFDDCIAANEAASERADGYAEARRATIGILGKIAAAGGEPEGFGPLFLDTIVQGE